MIVGNRDCRAPGARTHKGVRADDHLLIWTSHPNPLGKSLWIRTPPARVALVFAFLRCVPWLGQSVALQETRIWASQMNMDRHTN